MAAKPLLMPGYKAAQFVGISRNTLRKLVASGEGPARVRLPGVKRFYFSRDALIEWIESREHTGVTHG
jgi:excisionase family DNA binding protein